MFRRNSFIIFLLLILGVVVTARAYMQFARPLTSQAQTSTAGSGPDNVGPHAAFFDPGGNISIANMVKGKTSKNLPITVMVGVSASKEEMVQVLSSTNGLQAIIRVVGVRVNTNGDDARRASMNIGEAVAAAGLPSDTLVVFGNELNNLDKEWLSCPGSPCPGQEEAAGRNYRNIFNEFAGVAKGFTPVPAPPDQYNSVYDWQNWERGFGVFSGPRVANVYSQDLSLWQQLGGVVAFTEYGPDPTDATLQDHIDFYANTPLPDGIRYATTLIPDRCSSDDFRSDTWLYYIDGAIYDAQGNEIDPETCSALAGESEYQRTAYPFYTGNIDEMSQYLANDYEVSCMPKADYVIKKEGDGSFEEYFFSPGIIDANGEGEGCQRANIGGTEVCLFDKPTAELSIYARGISQLFGVLRDESNVIRRFDAGDPAGRSFLNRWESVEQWFGANNPVDERYLDQTPEEIRDVHQGPYYKLADTQMQCMAAMEVLKAGRELCAEWSARHAEQSITEPELPCPLENQPVRGTGKTMKQMWDSYEPGFCDTYFNSVNTKQRSQMTSRLDDLLNVDLYMETAYRPAFIVIVTDVDQNDPAFDGQITTESPRQRFSTTRRDGKFLSPNTRHLVDYLVYHVPATLTDTDNGPEFVTNDAQYTDVVKRTVMTFTPAEEYQEFFETAEEYRKIASEAVANGDDLPAEELTIECHEDECRKDDLDPLRVALINFINGMASKKLDFDSSGEFNNGYYNCNVDEDNTENAETGKQIGSPLEARDEFYTENEPAKGMKNAKRGANIGSETIDEASGDFVMQQFMQAGEGVYNPRPLPVTRVFNVYPHRANAEFVADRMDALFTVEQQKENFNGGAGYFDKLYATFNSNFGGESQSLTYRVPQLSGGVQLYDELGNPLYDTKSIIIKVDETNKQPFNARYDWLGKIFNRSTRAVTQLVFNEGSAILECARDLGDAHMNTEEFLTKCPTYGGGEGNTPIKPGGGDKCIEGGIPIASNTLKDLIYTTSVKYNVPVEVLLATLYLENCRSNTSYNGQTASICNKSDEFLAPYLREGVEYPHTAGCPGQTRPSGNGVFQFNQTSFQAFKENDSDNACSIVDSIQVAARYLNANYSSKGIVSTIGNAPPASQWTIDQMKLTVTRWAANVDTCEEHPFAREYCRVINSLFGKKDDPLGVYEGVSPFTNTCE